MTALIEVKDLTKTYSLVDGDDQLILKGISFEIAAGEFVAIMGHSGSGKSTLMNLLGCLARPSSGSYSLGGCEITRLSDRELTKIRGEKIGFVFQNFNLLANRTIADNILMPLIYRKVDKKEGLMRVHKLLEQVNLKGYEQYFPRQLSGGMQQRVAVARALINQPEIILADEPTGNLDTATSQEIMELFVQLNQRGITVILVTHEEDIADYAKRLICILDGVKAYDGDRLTYIQRKKQGEKC